MNTSFGPVQQIDAGVLNVGYVESGRSDGPAVVLLHGWPYDIHSYADVAPILASEGYRVIVPYLRGYGTTRLGVYLCAVIHENSFFVGSAGSGSGSGWPSASA